MHLSMDGVDDNIYVPTVSYNKIVLDVYLYPKTGESFGYVIDTQSRLDGGFLREHDNGTFSSYFSSYTGAVIGQRTTITCNTSSVKNYYSRLFSRSDGAAQFIKGDIYDVKFYNGATLVTHYNMNTGTVQDQSGNGNHATLTGGTWVSEGGNTPTVVDAGNVGLIASANLLSQASKLSLGSSTIQASSSLVSTGARISNGESDLIANSSLSALANRILNSTSTMNANSSLSADGEILSLQVSASLSASSTMQAIGTRIRKSNTDLSAKSSFTADGEIITFEITANLSASSQMMANGTLLKSGESVLSANGNMLATGTIIYDGESMFFASSELSALLGEASILIGTLQLEGSKELNIYLQASKELEVTLQANKELYVNLKGVMN